MTRAPILSAAAAALLLSLAAMGPLAAEDAATPAAPAMTPAPAAAPAKGEFDLPAPWSYRRPNGEDRLLDQLDRAGRQGLLLLSENSKEAFLKNAEANIKKAKDFVLAKDSAAASGKTKDFTEDDVNTAVKKVIDERTKDGAFVFRDPKLNADLHLVFEQIKNVRGMHGYGWFPNVIFHDKDEPKKQYAIDFWFKPVGQDLKLMDIRVQKGPKQEGDSWVMITRAPQAWWWLPAGQHPGDMEVTRAWQVMSAIHGYIATHKDKDGNLPIKDDQDRRDPAARIRRDPPAGAPPQERGGIFRLHRLPQAWEPGPIL